MKRGLFHEKNNKNILLINSSHKSEIMLVKTKQQQASDREGERVSK